MSDWGAVNLIAEDGHVTVLTHRWAGGAFEILPQIKDAGRTAADTKTMAANLTVLDDDFTPETVKETDLSKLLISQRENNLLSYNLYVRKGGWDIEVWSNGGHPLVLSKDGASGTICPIRTNAQVIITRMPLEKLSKKVTKAATAMMEKEGDRVLAEHNKAVETSLGYFAETPEEVMAAMVFNAEHMVKVLKAGLQNFKDGTETITAPFWARRVNILDNLAYAIGRLGSKLPTTSIPQFPKMEAAKAGK